MSKLAQMIMEWLDEFNAKWPARPKIPNACLDSLVDLVERIVGEENERLRDKLDTATLAARVASEEFRKLEAEISWQKERNAMNVLAYTEEKSQLRARIDAALGLYETAMEIPPLAEQMYKALKGEA